MYSKPIIDRINKTVAPTEPLKVLAGVGVCSITSIPFIPAPAGYRRVGQPIKVSVEPSCVAPDALPQLRAWLRDTKAQFIAFASKGAVNGELFAYEPIPA
jgi:hypothetical protein